ncbi:alanine dehydrogenase [Cutibacterium acnes JCM 18916]|nr:alanine dehydrogenase [Cutibacterium acnes JCM 18916]
MESVWGDADLVLKVKEPVAEEYGRLHEGLVLFLRIFIWLLMRR